MDETTITALFLEHWTLLAAMVAINVATQGIKLGIHAFWPTAPKPILKFILYVAPVALGALLVFAPSVVRFDEPAIRFLIGIGLGTFAEIGYKLVRRRVTSLSGDRMLPGRGGPKA